MGIKSLIPNSFKDWVKLKIGLNRNEYSYLLNYPRFQQGEISLDGETFTYVDAHSFVFMFEEIWLNQLYSFKSESKTPIIVDLGANIGLASIYFKKIFPNSKVYSFEPDKEIFEILEKNISSQKLTEIYLENKGAWIESGRLSFTSDGSDGGRISENGIQTIEVLEVNEILNEHEKIDFLKIDIEGAEHKVIPALLPSLYKVDRLFVEFHSFELGDQLLEILQILKDAGFKYYIDSPGFRSQAPFSKLRFESGMDFQLNICAFKDSYIPQFIQ